MLQALAVDLMRIAPPGELRLLWDHRITAPPLRDMPGEAAWDLRVVPVTTLRDQQRHFDRLLRDSDGVILIAPETDGILEQWVARAEAMGARLLSPGLAFCRWGADKTRSCNQLRMAGVPAAESWCVSTHDDAQRIPQLGRPLVIKPNDGAGSDQIHRCLDGDVPQWLKRSEPDGQRSWCVQRLLEGVPISMAVLCGSHGGELLPPCSQQIGPSFIYGGGAVLDNPPWHAAARETICGAVARMPPAIGYVGFDMIAQPRNDGSWQATIIEVNPRLTTSYVGLRRAMALIGDNLGERMYRIATGSYEPVGWHPYGRQLPRVEFDFRGEVHHKEQP